MHILYVPINADTNNFSAECAGWTTPLKWLGCLRAPWGSWCSLIQVQARFCASSEAGLQTMDTSWLPIWPLTSKKITQAFPLMLATACWMFFSYCVNPGAGGDGTEHPSGSAAVYEALRLAARLAPTNISCTVNTTFYTLLSPMVCTLWV